MFRGFIAVSELTKPYFDAFLFQAENMQRHHVLLSHHYTYICGVCARCVQDTLSGNLKLPPLMIWSILSGGILY